MNHTFKLLSESALHHYPYFSQDKFTCQLRVMNLVWGKKFLVNAVMKDYDAEIKLLKNYCKLCKKKMLEIS